MSTEKQIHFRLEDNGDSIKVDIQGSGRDLVILLAQAISSSENVRSLIQFALLSTIANEQESQDEDSELAEVLSQMKMGEA